MRESKAKEAQRAMGIRAWRKAVLLGDVVGHYTAWKKGEIVRAKRTKSGRIIIEREKWTGSLVPLANTMHDVPASKVKFLD
jgi:hypothetical protein